MNGYNHGYGTAIITSERLQQIYNDGWTPEHDDTHICQELAQAALCYAMPANQRYKQRPPAAWPWGDKFWHPEVSDRIAELAKAGALIAAEIDRLIRLGVKSDKWDGIVNSQDQKP